MERKDFGYYRDSQSWDAFRSSFAYDPYAGHFLRTGGPVNIHPQQPVIVPIHGPQSQPCYVPGRGYGSYAPQYPYVPQPINPTDIYRTNMQEHSICSVNHNPGSDLSPETDNEEVIEASLKLTTKLSKKFIVYGSFADMDIEVKEATGLVIENDILLDAASLSLEIKEIHMPNEEIDFTEIYNNPILHKEITKFLLKSGGLVVRELAPGRYGIYSEKNYELIAWMLGDKLLAEPIFKHIDYAIEATNKDFLESDGVVLNVFSDKVSKDIDVVVIDGKEHRCFIVEGSVMVNNREIDGIKYLWSLENGSYYILDDVSGYKAELETDEIYNFLYKIMLKRLTDSKSC